MRRDGPWSNMADTLQSLAAHLLEFEAKAKRKTVLRTRSGLAARPGYRWVRDRRPFEDGLDGTAAQGPGGEAEEGCPPPRAAVWMSLGRWQQPASVQV